MLASLLPKLSASLRKRPRRQSSRRESWQAYQRKQGAGISDMSSAAAHGGGPGVRRVRAFVMGNSNGRSAKIIFGNFSLCGALLALQERRVAH